MKASQFLDHLEDKGLLDKKVIEDLRKQVATRDSVTPERIAKLLVDNGHLTQYQSTTLINEAKNVGGKKSSAPSESTDLVDLPEDEEDPNTAVKQRAAAKEKQRESSSKSRSKSQKEGKRKGKKWQEEEELVGEVVDPSELRPVTRPENAKLTPTGRVQKEEQPKSKGAKLIMVASMSLGVLMIIGAILFFWLGALDGDKLFADGKNHYRESEYSDATEKLSTFADNFSGHVNASEARVMVGMCEIQVARPQADSERKAQEAESALRAAQRVLPVIVEEEKFALVRDELSSILPEIWDTFAEEAMKNEQTQERKKQLLLMADETYVLVNTGAYIPTSIRKSIANKLKITEEKIRRVRREIDEDKELAAAVKAVAASVEAQDSIVAWAHRKALLRRYPRLINNEQLIDSTQTIVDLAITQVSPESLSLSPTAEPVQPKQSTQFKSLSGVTRTGGNAAGLDGQIGYVLLGGSVYCIDMAAGKPLWRHFVGLETTIQPIPVSSQPGADALVADVRTNSIIRLEAKTGNVKWALQLPSAFPYPVIDTDRVLVSTEEGLVVVNLESGSAEAIAKLPAKLYTSVGHAPQQKMYIQVAEESMIFALEQNNLSCVDGAFLGHKPGSIVVAPFSVGGLVFVAENITHAKSLLHVLTLQNNRIGQAQPPIQLSGNVIVPPAVDKQHILVTTDRGSIHVLAVQGGDTPVAQLATRPSSGARQKYYGLIKDGAHVWTAGNRFEKLVVQAAQQQLISQFSVPDGDYVAPLQSFGNVILNVRRPAGQTGFNVTATEINDKTKKVVWELDLGCPTTILPDPVSKKPMIFSSRGGMFDLASSAAVNIQPAVAGVDASYAEVIPVKDRLVFVSRASASTALLYGTGGVKKITLEAALGQPTAKPTAFDNGFIVSTDAGQVGLYGFDGKLLAYPYQPALEGGQKVQWSEAVIAGPDSVVIMDDRSMLRRIAVRPRPKPHLALAVEVKTKLPANVSVGVTGGLAYTALADAKNDVLQAYKIEDLTEANNLPLKGRAYYGPVSVADHVFVASDQEGLLCVKDDKLLWSVDLKGAQVAGAPYFADDRWIVATSQGQVLQIGADGSVMSTGELGQPIIGSPVLVGSQILATGYDGTVFILNGGA